MDCQDVALWKDALTSYSGQKFDMSWEDRLNMFHHHIYSKEYEGNRGKKKIMKVRDEIQEYPNKPLEDAFIDKLCDTYGTIDEF